MFNFDSFTSGLERLERQSRKAAMKAVERREEGRMLDFGSFAGGLERLERQPRISSNEGVAATGGRPHV